MYTVYMNLRGANGGGGPSVFAYKMAIELRKRGFKLIYDNPQKSKVAFCIIESGKVLRKINRSLTKVVVRIDGAYFKEYWHGGPGREWRPDMTALHKAIQRDVAEVDTMIYQSRFSKKLIDAEIANRGKNFEIIHNGVDINLFKPTNQTTSGKLRLVHVGLMRNGYLMEQLLGTYSELRKRGHNVCITMVGSMDGECQKVYSQYKNDNNVIHKPKVANSLLPMLYSDGDIYVGPRQGSSSDNVIAEAQACGLPVIIPSWGGNVDMVKDRETGIIVTTGHWSYDTKYTHDIADAVEMIAQDLMGYKRRARKHARKELSIETMANKYIKAMSR